MIPISLLNAKIGETKMFNIFYFVALIGHIIATIAMYKLNYSLILISRVILALGMEAISLASKTLLIKWFNKNELSLTFAVMLSTWRLGTMCTSIITPLIYMESK